MRVKITCLTMLMLFLGVNSTLAEFNAYMAGEIDTVYVYAESDSIYIRLKNQPASHPSCNSDYFVIDSGVSMDRRKMMLSRLLTAYLLKENVSIGYDANGNCAESYIRVHRAG